MSVFNCDTCKYVTHRKFCFDRHLESDRHLQKVKEEADKRQNIANEKNRLSFVKQMKNKYKNGMQPNYNPYACEIIELFNKNYEFNFQHAENGGEVCIDGYWPDGFDKELGLIIELHL